MGSRRISQGMSLEELVDASADALQAGGASRGKALALLAIERQADCVKAWTNLSWAELELGDPQAAADAAERALRIDPANAVAWHNLAEAHARAQNWEQALAYNNRALTLDQGPALFWAGRGGALMGLERFTEAVACFDKALAIDPQLGSARANRQIALAQADPARRDLLALAFGIAVQRADGRIGEHDLEPTVLHVFGGNANYDADLVRSFDAFAEANVGGNATREIVHLCEVNLVLARHLGDRGLAERCQRRLAEAVATAGTA
jgi:tetratricopeptide (TPR) repeat protein